MTRTHLAFLWHFHQPLYREPLTGRSAMPWVRLHATKGYTDLVALLADYPHMRMSINVVPSLLDQLETYAHGSVTDPALNAVRAPADGLTEAQARALLNFGFQVHWPTQVVPHARYGELLERRGQENNGAVLDADVLTKFSAQDYRDVQVFSTLAWMGFTLRRTEPAVVEAFAKGGNFTEDEKEAVLDVQARAVAEVIPRMKAAQDRDQLELTASPHYHPILPLLIDTDFARRAIAGATVAHPPFQAPQDARAQLRMAAASHARRFGRAPRGCWPSEGSVCPELIPLLADAGFAWCATDEGILANSTVPGHPGYDVTRPYRVRCEGAEVGMVFRHRELSDRIGFTYQGVPGPEAANEFLSMVQAVAANDRTGPAMVPVILDGENPWEHYPDSGEGFLRAVCEGVAGAQDITASTMSAAIDATGPGPLIEHLHSGSWIHHNLAIWGYGRDESAAWSALRHTREFLLAYERVHPEVDREAHRDAWRNIYAAEGSDWFWWYGTDFSSENDAEFDRLFRLHLQAVYVAMGADVPDVLDRPVTETDWSQVT